MGKKKAKTKKLFIGRQNQDIFFLVGGLILIGFLIFSLYQRVSYKSQAREQDGCIAGQVSDQGCAVHGCEAGTRRVCHCVENNKWQCTCTADNTCKGGSKKTNKPRLFKEESGNNQQTGQTGASTGLVSQIRNCALNVCAQTCQIPNEGNNQAIILTETCAACVQNCMGQ